jgi:hypothetical protein
MLSETQRQEFAEQGYLRLEQAFSTSDAAAMEDLLWSALAERQDIRRDEPESWSAAVITGLQDLKTNAVFDPIGGPATTGALDDLLGPDGWRRPLQWGQFLVTFPRRGDAIDPFTKAIWHSDYDYATAPDWLAGALVFSFLSAVPPHSGGTAVLEGSHRVVQRFVAARPRAELAPMKRARKALLASDPWLTQRASDAGDDWLERNLGREATIDGVRVRVAELTGAPGDVVVGHPWLLHAPAPNRAAQPRLMRVQRIHATEPSSP